MRTVAMIAFLYLTGLLSVVVGAHAFLVVSDPDSVGGFYLFPLMMTAPAKLLAFVPAAIGYRCMRRRPRATWRLVIGAGTYVLALLIFTSLAERRNLSEPMLAFVTWLVFSPQFLLRLGLFDLFGLFVTEGWRQGVSLVAVGICALAPLLVVLFATSRLRGNQPAWP